MTDRQRQILEYIRRTVASRGIPPTIREIGESIGIRSTNGVNKHLQALERAGLIGRQRGASRGIVLPLGRKTSASVPLLGQVAAGSPVLAPENREGEYTVDGVLFGIRSEENVFALKVRGESMIDAHIMDGDMVLVKECAHARNGEIVVALLDGETTIKRFYQEKGLVRLQPENSTMQAITIEQGDFRIIGKVIGVMRRVG